MTTLALRGALDENRIDASGVASGLSRGATPQRGRAGLRVRCLRAVLALVDELDARRRAGPGKPPAPTELVRVVGPTPRDRRRK